MKQSSHIIKALKVRLKSQGFTYDNVAEKLDLSLASVKRIFSTKHITLERIDMICEMLEIEISDLLQDVRKMASQVEQLTWKQEEQIVKNKELTLICICVINHWQFEDIMSYYNFSKHTIIKHLATLDKLKILELRENNKIKLLISPQFNWIVGGPIEKFFKSNLLQDFLHSNFSKDDESFICKFGMLTHESNIILQKKIKQLADEFSNLSTIDNKLSIYERSGSAFLLSLRPWTPSIFEKFIKKE